MRDVRRRGAFTGGQRRPIGGQPMAGQPMTGQHGVDADGLYARHLRHGGGGLGRDQHEPGARGSDHVGDAGRRGAGLYRHVGGAGFQHRQQGRDQVGSARDRDPDRHIRAHAPAAQLPGQRVAAPVELRVGHGCGAEDQCRRVRIPRDVRREQRGNGGVRGVGHAGAVPSGQQAALVRPAQVQVGQRRPEVAGELGQRGPELAEHPLRGAVGEAAAVPEERQAELRLVVHAQHQRIRRQPVHPGRAGGRIPGRQPGLQPAPVEHEQAVHQRGVRGESGPGQGRRHRRALVLPDPADAVVRRRQQVAHRPLVIDADPHRHRVDQRPHDGLGSGDAVAPA